MTTTMDSPRSERQLVPLKTLPKGSPFYMTERGRKVYISYGVQSETFLDMSGPDIMHSLEWAPLKNLTKIEKTYDLWKRVWV